MTKAVSRATGPAWSGADALADSFPLSLKQPPIDRLRPDDPPLDVLAVFVEKRARSWGGVAVPLSGGVTGALCVLLVLSLGFGGWLLAVRAGAVACSGFLCSVATLGGHLVPTLVLAGVCAGSLAGAMPMTRGLTRANGPQLAVIVAAALCGVVALAGAVALLLGALLALGLAFGLFVAFVDRF